MKTARVVCLLSLPAALMVWTAPAARADTNLDLARQLNRAFVDVAGKVSPSVVVISVTEKVVWAQPETGDDGGSHAPDGTPDFWRRFHRQFEEHSPEIMQGQGSGIIVRKDGYILTNRHVVDNADQIKVRLHDGRVFTGKVRGVDPGSDLAVVKIDAEDLPAATFADSSKTRVGEFAIAIGAPFAYDYSVTFGHVSAKGRSNVVPFFDGGASMDQDFIQTDANINPGNSGGPLLNINGEVIGINSVIRGLHTGIGFAIPSNLAKEVADKLIAEGKFPRAWLGIRIQAVKDNPDFNRPAGDAPDGVIVLAILPDSPSARSDLRTSDVITAVDDRPVSTAQQLRDEVRHKPIGRPITLDVSRNGKRVQVKIKPDEYVQPAFALSSLAPVPELAEPPGLGMTVHPLTGELAEQFGIEPTRGVIVVTVDRDSPADRKGIRPGDVITGIGQQPVSTPRQFSEALRKADLKKGVIVNLISGKTARFEIVREGTE
jgi:serine protease Do